MSRKLDAAIAEALGYEVLWRIQYDTGFGLTSREAKPDEPGAEPFYNIPHYSTDGNAMLELDAEMRARGWMIKIIFWGAMYEAIYSKPITDAPSAAATSAGIFKAYSPFVGTMPLAVALAARKALTSKEWIEKGAETP